MAGFTDRQYRLYKEIQVDFRKDVDPDALMDQLGGCLTADDVDRVQAKLKNEGRAKATGELLDRLRRRPNWENRLLEALQHPDLKLAHLAESFRKKSTELQIKITLDYRCLDGHNCSPPSTTEPGPSPDDAISPAQGERTEIATISPVQGEKIEQEEDVIASVSPIQGERIEQEDDVIASVSPVQGERTEQEEKSLSPVEDFLKTFKSRVDPEDFLQYLVRFKEEDEDEVRRRQRYEGRSSAAEELVSRLVTYKHWKDDLVQALNSHDSGLEDLGKALSDISIEENEEPRASQSVEPSSQFSAGQSRISMVHEFVRNRILDVRSEEELSEVLSMADQINSCLLKFEKGCLVLTLSVQHEETLSSIHKMYLGGVLGEVLKRDLLGEERIGQVLLLAAEKFAISSVEKLEFKVENLHLDVHISPTDYLYSLLNLRSYRDASIPSTAVQIVTDFRLHTNPRLLNSTSKLSPFLPPVVHKLLADPFIQGFYEDLTSTLESSDTDHSAAVIVSWLWNKLKVFTKGHELKDELHRLGRELGTARKRLFSGKQERCLFDVTTVEGSVRLQIAGTRGTMDSCSFSITTNAWEKLLKEGIICFSKVHQKYCFQSLVLEQYLIYMSGTSYSAEVLGYHQVFKLAENPAKFIAPLDDLGKSMEYLYLQYLILKTNNPDHRLEALKTIIPKDGTYKIDILKDSLEIQANVLNILIQEGLINKFEVAMSSSNIDLWDVSAGNITRTLHSSELRSLVNLAGLLSTLGTANICVEREQDEDRRAVINLRLNQGSPFIHGGHLTLGFTGASLNSLRDDIDILGKGLLKMPFLFHLDLSSTELDPEAYRKILAACRFSQLSSLVLTNTSLMDQKNPQPLGLEFMPQLKRLELERCRLGDVGIQAMIPDFKAAVKLTEVNVGDNDISSCGIMRLSGLLMDKENLRVVRVHKNNIGHDGAVALAMLFRNLPLLEVVNLCNCSGISEKGFQMIIESLEGKPLKKMNVRECGFSQGMAEKYFELLKKMPHFQHLDYGCNSIGVSEGSLQDRNSKISSLFLEMMSFNKNSWNHLSLWKCQLGFTSIFGSSSRLQYLSTLTDICLQENDLDDMAGVCIGDYMVASWHSLRCLNLRENIIGDLGAQRILEGIQVNPNLEMIYLDRNNIENINIAKNMVLFFYEQAKPGLRELDVSYNHVTEYRRNQAEIKKYLGEMKFAKVEDCAGYTSISYQDRTMRL